MLVCEELKKLTFEDRDNKKAYLNACKWIASNIIAKELKHVTYSITKDNSVSHGKVVVTLYVTADEGKIKENMCSVCKEFARNMWLSENKYRCEVCKVGAYRNRILENLTRLKQYAISEVRKSENTGKAD